MSSSVNTSASRYDADQNTSSNLLGLLSPVLKGASQRFNQLSTTQKVVGGALLALGIGYLTRRNPAASGKAAGSATDQASTLSELLYFVNDRIEGYKRAVDESQDDELRGYYKQLVSQSQQFSNEVSAALRQLGEEQHDHTTLKGKLYRRWMDAKAALTGQDEKAILGSNIYGEEWALKAYQDALNDGTLTGAIRTAVERQYGLSQKTYAKLKSLKDKQ